MPGPAPGPEESDGGFWVGSGHALTFLPGKAQQPRRLCRSSCGQPLPHQLAAGTLGSGPSSLALSSP